MSIILCPYIQLNVSLLYTRVRDNDTNEYKQLARITKYVEGTIGLPLILSIDKPGNIKWYVDAAFALQQDMRSHTGGIMNMVMGRAYVPYRQQNLNTKSSTKDKIVGVDNVLNQVIWT